jgi:hypothetical protein
VATIVAAVILLVFSRPSGAKIVYTPTKITIRPDASYNLDLKQRWSHPVHYLYKLCPHQRGVVCLRGIVDRRQTERSRK